jgi:hypothetical protein
MKAKQRWTGTMWAVPFLTGKGTWRLYHGDLDRGMVAASLAREHPESSYVANIGRRLRRVHVTIAPVTRKAKAKRRAK